MKKIITTFLALALLAGCSSSTAKTTTSSKKTKAKETASATPTATPTEDPIEKMKNDGVIDYSDDRFALKLDSVETASSDDGKNLLICHFTFTNKTQETVFPMNMAQLGFFQNGVEVDDQSYSFNPDDPHFQGPDFYQTQIMAGATAQLHAITTINDTTSPVTIIVTNYDYTGHSPLAGQEVDQETVNLQ